MKNVLYRLRPLDWKRRESTLYAVGEGGVEYIIMPSMDGQRWGLSHSVETSAFPIVCGSKEEAMERAQAIRLDILGGTLEKVTLGWWGERTAAMTLEGAAEIFARLFHAGQFRRDGITPYTKHLEDVVGRVPSTTMGFLRATAWLHDVLEDTEATKGDLGTAGFPEAVIEAVIVLTRTEQPYDEYLSDVRDNSLAKEVKIADMISNLADSPTESQIAKYAKGLAYLSQ